MSIPENLSTQFQKVLSRLDQSIENEFPTTWNGRDVSLLSSDANKGEQTLEALKEACNLATRTVNNLNKQGVIQVAHEISGPLKKTLDRVENIALALLASNPEFCAILEPLKELYWHNLDLDELETIVFDPSYSKQEKLNKWVEEHRSFLSQESLAECPQEKVLHLTSLLRRARIAEKVKLPSFASSYLTILKSNAPSAQKARDIQTLFAKSPELSRAGIAHLLNIGGFPVRELFENPPTKQELQEKICELTPYIQDLTYKKLKEAFSAISTHPAEYIMQYLSPKDLGNFYEVGQEERQVKITKALQSFGKIIPKENASLIQEVDHLLQKVRQGEKVNIRRLEEILPKDQEMLVQAFTRLKQAFVQIACSVTTHNLKNIQDEMIHRINKGMPLNDFRLPKDFLLSFVQSHGSFVTALDLSKFPNLSNAECQLAINACPNLEKLQCERDVQGISFASCTNLKAIQLYEARNLTNAQLQEFSSSLESIDLSKVDVRGFSFAKFTNLKAINLFAARNLTNAQLQELSSSLEHINLSRTDVAGFSFAKFTNLKAIKLEDARNLTNAQLQELPSSLESINLFLMDVRGFSFAKFANLKAISLSFVWNLTNEQLQELSSSLESIDLSGANARGFSFAKFTKLKAIKLEDARNLTNAQLQELPSSLESINLFLVDVTSFSFAKFTNLKAIQLYEARNLTNAQLQEFSSSLESIDLSKVDVRGFSFAKFTNLKAIQLYEARNLTNAQLQELPSSLESIDLYRVDVRGFSFAKFTNLKDINLAGAENLTNEQLQELSSSLESTDLSWVAVAGFSFAKFTKLKSINLSNAKNLMNEQLQELSSSLESIDLFGMDVEGFSFAKLQERGVKIKYS